MVIKTAEIIFNNKPSKFNKDLVEFLKKNLNTIIIRAQIKFRYVVVNSDDFDSLKSRGITRLPAMVYQNRNFISVPDIVNELKSQVSNSKSMAPPKSEEEVVQDFFKQSLGDIKTDSEGKILVNEMDQEEENAEKRNLENNISKAMEMRKNAIAPKGKQGKSSMSYASPSDGNSGSIDDIFSSRLLDESGDRTDNLSTDINTAMRNSSSKDDDPEMMRMMLDKL